MQNPHQQSQRVPFASQPQSQPQHPSPSIPANQFYLQNQSIPRTFSPQGAARPHQQTINHTTPQDNVSHYQTPQNYPTSQQQQQHPHQGQNQILASPISQSPVPMTPIQGPPTPSATKALHPRVSISQPTNNNQNHHQLTLNTQRSPSGSSMTQLQGINPLPSQNPPIRTTTTMGPPLSANPISQNQNVNFQLGLNHQQSRSSISSNLSNNAALSLPGAGTLRMLQYSEGYSFGIHKASYHYWRDFVSEFFLPDATFRLVLWNPASCEQKGFEVPSSVLPRYYHTTCTSGLTSSQMHFESPREHLGQSPSIPPPIASKFANVFPSPSASHFFESSRTNLISTFDNGWQVQMSGFFRASLVIRNNSLKIENLDFTVNAHTSFLPGVAILRRKAQEKIPLDIVEKIKKDWENEGSGKGVKGETDEDGKNKIDSDGLSDGKKRKRDNSNINNGPDTPISSKKSDGNQDDKSLEEKDEKDVDGGNSTKNESSPNSAQRNDRNEENESGSAYTMTVDQTFLPESPVNEYGITLRAMRCLEITESVCQLRDLIDHSHSRRLGPMEALRNFSEQFRRVQGQNQSQIQNPNGFSPINGNNGFPMTVSGTFPNQNQFGQGIDGGNEGMSNGFDRSSPSQNQAQNQAQSQNQGQNQNQNQNQSQNQSTVETSESNASSNSNKRKSSAVLNSRDPTPSPSQTPKRIAPSPKLGTRRGAITETDFNPNKRVRE